MGDPSAGTATVVPPVRCAARSSCGSHAAAVEGGAGGLARLALRRPGHAPLCPGRPAVCRGAAYSQQDGTGGYPILQRLDSSGVPDRLGPGAFFGIFGDRIGRTRTLMLTILTYALFTGLSTFAQTWWQLGLFRFIAALGIGGEWAVGASLLSETWPRRGDPGWPPCCKRA